MGILDRFLKKPKPETKRKIEKKPEVKEVKVASAKEKLSTLRLKSEEGKPEENKEIKAKKSKKVETDLAFKILIKPLITEKATALVSQNKYAFKVAPRANKVNIKKAISNLYGVEPLAVNIINERGKRVTYGRIRGKKSNWKKAIVTLKPGDKIEIYEGV